MGRVRSSKKAPSSSTSGEDQLAELKQNKMKEQQQQQQPADAPPPPVGPERKPSVKSTELIEDDDDSSLEPQPLNESSQQQQSPQTTPQLEGSQQQQEQAQHRPSFRVDWSIGSLNYFHGPRYLCRDVLDHYNQFRYNCGMFVNNSSIQYLVIFLISINAIMMGIGTFDFVTENQSVQATFELVDQIFLILFTIELGLQFIYHGWRLILDGWLLFDLVIIVTSWCFSSVQIIRAFRIFRALRLVTRIKIMKNLILGKSVYCFPKTRGR